MSCFTVQGRIQSRPFIHELCLVLNLWFQCFQAAYLVAVADPSSVAGRPGLIDQTQFINSKQEIVDACESLLNPEANQQQVVLNVKLLHVIFITLLEWCEGVQLKLVH